MNRSLPFFIFTLLGLTLGLSGCGGTSDQYFRLSAGASAPLQTAGLAVGVGPVTLPAYVDRAELVFQSDENQYQVPSKVRWAGSLSENFTRVLATDVAGRLNSGNVVAYPWGQNVNLRYQVTVTVQQFHAVSGKEALLEASWRIQEPESQRILVRKNGSFREPIVGDGYGPVVAAESRLVSQLSEAISSSIRR